MITEQTTTAIKSIKYHLDGRHEYLLAGSAIGCDVLINLPKLKTHKKAGVTLSLKNLVGINTDKNWLPHHTEGYPPGGGIEHPQPNAKHRIERRLVAASHKALVAFPRSGLAGSPNQGTQPARFR